MSSQAGVFVLQGDQSIVAMQPAQFAAEEVFQDLIARFPMLLVGDQVDPEAPRRWVLVKREQAIGLDDASGGRWSIDHVFLDQDGIPTLVEVKRHTDTRIRREVVGQMLDYAANCGTFWAPGALRSSFEQTCAAAQRASEEVLRDLVGVDGDADAFWPLVDKNLSDGRIRLLFVADVIPAELRRIVEFLNRQMSPAEVLAIELRQFEGQGLRTIVPMVMGKTDTSAKKNVAIAQGPTWTVDDIVGRIAVEKSATQAHIASIIVDCMRTVSDRLAFGPGRIDGSVYPLIRIKGVKVNPVYLSAVGKLYFGLGWLKDKPIFSDVEMRAELIRRFSSVEQSGLSNADLNGYPSLPLAVIDADPDGVGKIREAFKWLADAVKDAG